MAVFKLQWTPPTNASSHGQNIEYKKSTDAVWTVAGSVGPAMNTFTVTGLEDNVQYDFKINSLCLYGGTISSIPVTVISIGCPQVTLTKDITSIFYSFDIPGTAVTGVTIDLLNSSNIVLDSQSPTVASHINGSFTNLTPNTSYTVRVIIKSGATTKNCNGQAIVTDDLSCTTLTVTGGKQSVGYSYPIPAGTTGTEISLYNSSSTLIGTQPGSGNPATGTFTGIPDTSDTYDLFVRLISGSYGKTCQGVRVYGNDLKSGNFIKQCGPGETGSTVTYTIPKNTYFYPNKVDADTAAQNDVNANGQQFANDNGTCTPIIPTLILNNVDTNYSDSSRIYVDVDTVLYVNDVFITQIFDTESRTFTLNYGDQVRIIQRTNPEYNPWPPDSTARLRITHEGSQLYDHSTTFQSEVLNEYTFTAVGGTYVSDSTGVSTVQGWRKYTFTSRINLPVSSIEGIEYKITDRTNNFLTAKKGALKDVVSEFNVVNDGGNLSVEVENGTTDTYTFNLTNDSGSFNQTVAVGPESSYTFPDFVKSNLIGTISQTTTLPYKWIPDPDTAYCEETVVEDDSWTQFASPVTPFIQGANLVYLDRSLNKILRFDPRNLTQADITNINNSGINIPQMVAGTAPDVVGWYYDIPNNRCYVQGDYTSGVICMNATTGALIKHFPGQSGQNGPFIRGEMAYMPELNQVWALGNSGAFKKIDLATNNEVAGGISVMAGSVWAFNTQGKVYVVRDGGINKIEIYSVASSQKIKEIENVAQNLNPNNNLYTIRGFYMDATANRLYMGEVSSTPQIIVVDTTTDTIVQRIPLPKEVFAYGSVGVINYNPVRGKIYVGGGLFTQSSASDSVARIWVMGANAVEDVITPSANRSINNLIYYPFDNTVYISSRGRVPQDNPNNGHETDGVLFRFT